MKLDRHGKSEPINEELFLKISKGFHSEHHKLLFAIAYYTGERWGAIRQLRVEDVYRDPARRIPFSELTYRKRTTKCQRTRQVPIAPALALRLKAYTPPLSGYLFPSPCREGLPMSFDAFDKALRRALAQVGLAKSGISSHGTRRGFATDLHAKGISHRVIQSLTGHASLSMLSEYIDVSDKQRQSAIALR